MLVLLHPLQDQAEGVERSAGEVTGRLPGDGLGIDHPLAQHKERIVPHGG